MPELVNLGDDGNASPFFRVEKKPQLEPCSLDALPDKCLFEILRRLASNRERSKSACVSKRWLMLLISIRSSELSLKEEESLKSAKKPVPHLNLAGVVDGEEIKSTGCLTRWLEGREATDVRVAAVAVGSAGLGGLRDLVIGRLTPTPGLTPTPVLTDLGLSAVARCCPSLEVLHIWEVTNVTDAGLAELARGCPMIKRLVLCRCPLVTGKGLLAVAEKFPNLVYISLGSCVSIGNEGLQAICCGRPKLKSVSIRDCPLIGDQGIAAVMRSASSSLAQLHLEGCYRITLDGVLACLVNCNTKIETLALVRCLGIKDIGSCSDGLPECESLRSLTIRDCPGFTSASLAVVGKICPSLINLDLGDLVGVTDAGLLPVIESAACGLVEVNLRGCANLADSAICALVQEHGYRLRVLNLGGCNKLTDRVLLKISKHCTMLEMLDMSGADITDYGIAFLASARLLKVRVLEFAGCYKVTPRILPVFGNMGPTLFMLNLQNCTLICQDDISSLKEKLSGCFISVGAPIPPATEDAGPSIDRDIREA